MLRNATLIFVVVTLAALVLSGVPSVSGPGTTLAPSLSIGTSTSPVSLAPPSVSASAPSHPASSPGPDYLANVPVTTRNTSPTNPNDTAISAANATSLKMIWSSQITNESPIASTIAAATEVVGDTAYVGDWDGNETAVNALTGQVLWQRFLGQTSVPNCNSPRGVTSSAAIYNGTVYVGGGADWWYALNATTGAMEWQTYVGDSNASGGNYNWASPVIYNGYEYIGAASDCDLPLVRGELMQVSFTRRTQSSTPSIPEPTGQTGGTVWTTPTFDPELNTSSSPPPGTAIMTNTASHRTAGGMVALNMSDISLGSCAATCDNSETLRTLARCHLHPRHQRLRYSDNADACL